MPRRHALIATRRSIPQEIATLLREEILDGEWAPDAPLRQEHLARRFGTSQAPIREAFRQLEAQGLAKASTNRGVRVAPVSVTDAEEIGALRLALEPDLASSAAINHAEIDKAAARTALKAMERARNPSQLLSANHRFNAAIYRAAGRPMTVEIVTGLRARFERYLRLMWRNSGNATLSNEGGVELLEMLLAGKSEMAWRFTARRIETTSAEILRALGDQESVALTAPDPLP